MDPAAAAHVGHPLIEIGWVLAGKLDEADVEATRLARDRVRAFLIDTFPHYAWKMPLVHRREMLGSHRVTPVTLLDAGAIERETAHWDFAVVVCEADLKGRFKPIVFGAPCQALGVAVLSTARLDPEAAGVDCTPAERVALMADRVVALALHLFGHLNDIFHHPDPDNYMFDLDGVGDFDRMERYSEGAVQRLRRALDAVADLRVEEQRGFAGQARGAAFALKAMWQSRRAILNATVEIRPWLFPFLLSRLTIAAASTLLVLINTAEAWDLGMSQSPAAVLSLSIGVLAGTSAFIIQRQRLLSTHKPGGLTEQSVASSTAIALAVMLGMATTYALLFGSTLLIGAALFTDALIHSWASAVEPPITWVHHLTLAGFVASLGLTIGALGASFESEDYFRTVALVDEET